MCILNPRFRHRSVVALAILPLLFLSAAAATRAQITTNDPPSYGPYNAIFLADGEGLHEPLIEHDSVLQADSPWSLYCWMRTDVAVRAPTLVAGIGNPAEEYPRYLALDANKLILWMGNDNSLSAPAVLSSAKWHFLAATFDGSELHLYADGAQVGIGKLDLGSVSHVLNIAPPNSPLPSGAHFGGKIASLTLLRRALDADDIEKLSQQSTDFSLVEFEEASKPWPVQTRAQAGYRAPQDASTMPTSK